MTDPNFTAQASDAPFATPISDARRHLLFTRERIFWLLGLYP